MTEKEFLLFVSALRTYYPKENILPNKQSIELWFKQLEDIPYNVAEVSLNKWVALNKWSPSIADIRQMSVEVTQGGGKDWGEAWEDVFKSFGKYGSYREAEALESFDPITRQAVKQMGYKNLCWSENITADRANFRIIYESIKQRKQQEANIPPKLSMMIDTVLLEKGGD